MLSDGSHFNNQQTKKKPPFGSLFDNRGSRFWLPPSGAFPANSVYKLISIYGSTLDNKDKGSNLLHKLLLEGRIQIIFWKS